MDFTGYWLYRHLLPVSEPESLSMIAYIFGAGASVHANYPLASRLLPALANWLDGQDSEQPAVAEWRTRIEQLRHTFGSLDDFEKILGELDKCGTDRVQTQTETAYAQCMVDLLEDATRSLSRIGQRASRSDGEPRGFYPQYLRDQLVSAVREFFRDVELRRTAQIAYDRFANDHASIHDILITFNYDVALERALKSVDKWDIGSGYGFSLFTDRTASPTNVLKLHGSVNWFQHPMQQAGPPLIFPRDLALLGYHDLQDVRVNEGGCSVANTGTLILPDPAKRFYWEQLWLPLWALRRNLWGGPNGGDSGDTAVG
jgi:hypothetical protein